MTDMTPTAHSTDDRRHGVHRQRRLTGAAAATVVGLTLLVTGCGDDDPDQAFCDAVASLDSDVEAISDLDVAAEGTDALRTALGDVEADLAEVRATGAEVAPEELSALDSALSDLQGALSDVSDDATADEVSAIATALQQTAQAAERTVTTFQETCG